MSNRNLVRQGETMIAIESTPATVDFQDILDATKIVCDDISEAPWDCCNGFEHTWTSARHFDFDPSDMQGYCHCNGLRDCVVIQLPADRDCRDVAAYARANGASRQVAAELAAANRRHTLTHEIVGPGPDGGPVLLCACPNLPAAQAIKLALESTLATT